MAFAMQAIHWWPQPSIMLLSFWQHLSLPPFSISEKLHSHLSDDRELATGNRFYISARIWIDHIRAGELAPVTIRNLSYCSNPFFLFVLMLSTISNLVR